MLDTITCNIYILYIIVRQISISNCADEFFHIVFHFFTYTSLCFFFSGQILSIQGHGRCTEFARQRPTKRVNENYYFLFRSLSGLCPMPNVSNHPTPLTNYPFCFYRTSHCCTYYNMKHVCHTKFYNNVQHTDDGGGCIFMYNAWIVN